MQTTANPAVARLHQWPESISTTLTEALRFLTDRAAQEVGVSAGAAITLLTTGGRRITSAASDATAEALSALHDSHHENPGTAAWLTGLPVPAADTSAWPEWMAQANALGARSVVFAALRTPQRLLGTLMVYSREPGAYRRSDAAMLDGYARDAAILIDETQRARTRFLRGTR